MQTSWLAVATLMVLWATLTSSQEVMGKRKRDPMQTEMFCRNFTVGSPRDNEFYSPLYPKPYPAEIACFRTITADVGYFVRIDFRDVFQVSFDGELVADVLKVILYFRLSPRARRKSASTTFSRFETAIKVIHP